MKCFNSQPQFNALSTGGPTFLLAAARPMRRRGASAPGGFTLVELLVSLLIVVLLLIGVNKVFGTAAKTVEAGYSLSSALREHRSIESVIADDTRDMLPVNQQPAIMIMQREVAAYIDPVDEQHYQALNAANGWGAWGGKVQLAPAHRCDTLGFFAHGNFRRQTGLPAGATGSGSPASFQPNLTSTDAYIHYGILSMPSINPLDPNAQNYATSNNTYAKDYFLPGSTAGQYNPSSPSFAGYTKNWVFGRTCFLLVPSNGTVVDSNKIPQTYYQDIGAAAGATANLTMGSMSPGCTFMANGAAVTDTSPYYVTSQDPNASGEQPLLFDPTGWYNSTNNKMVPINSLCDVGIGSNATMVQHMNAFGALAPYPSYNQKMQMTNGWAGWWMGGYSPSPSWGTEGICMWRTGTQASSYWCGLNSIYRDSHTNTNDLINQLSQTTPCLASGVSDVIIEFAGDYLNQKNPPASLPPPQQYQTDGEIDVMDYNTDKRIRWYGMPRDTKLNGYIDVNQDVVPPSWFFPYNNNQVTGGSTGPYGAPSYTPFEQWNGDNGNYIWLCPHTAPPLSNGAFPCPVTQPLTTGPSGTPPFLDCRWTAAQGTRPQPAYPYRNVDGSNPSVYDDPDLPRRFVFAWGAGELQHQNNAASGWPVCARAPWMIRITIKITDPNNPQAPLQQYQYIMDLRQQ